MKYLDEYRDPKLAGQLSRQIHKITTRPWVIMEVCGGQTHAIVKFGIDTLLPDKIELVHGPGCPVCVTPLEMIDRALAIAAQKDVIFCSFGDMLRVPGSKTDLLSVKAQGGDVRIVYSPLDALKIAQDNPQQEIVFFAVGFETTAPANAMAVYQAKELGLRIFRCSFPMFWSRRRWKRFCRRKLIACRVFWPRATCVRSWAIQNIRPLPPNIKCLLS